MGYYKTELWETKEIGWSSTMGGSASHLREIVFKKELSVKEFIDAVINLNDGYDWGTVFVNNEELLKFNYFNGESRETILNHTRYLEIKDTKIKKATSSNEWYEFHFNIEI